MASFSIIGLVLCCLIALANANYKNVGDHCTITRTGAAGICKLRRNCIEVRNELRFKQILPTICDHPNGNIVCCPIKVETPESNNLSIAARKCKEYSQYVYSTTTAQVGFETIASRVDRCGHTAIPLIVGGMPAREREFPHSALLGYEQPERQIVWKCGGTLVSRRYILTAAHCLEGEHGEVSHVRLGEFVISSTNKPNVIEVAIEQKIQHPQYRKSKKYDDIALLKLPRKIELSPNIRPICLPTENLQPEKSIATGWGAVQAAGDMNDVLLKVTLESYSNEECNVFFQSVQDIKLRKGIIETQLCAGWKNRNETRDTCQGDSGGPLQIYNSDPRIHCMYTQVAITSFGIGCNSTHIPGVYTRVYNYRPWIERIIWAPGEDD